MPRAKGESMNAIPHDRGLLLAAISRAMVRLHKEQMGRGPTHARSNFVGPDAITTVLSEVLTPAERTMVQLGEQQRVREGRSALQAAAAAEFINAIEPLVERRVIAFASSIDPDADIAFENFMFAPSEVGAHGRDEGEPGAEQVNP
jgi:uncharacterized protein YbcI